MSSNPMINVQCMENKVLEGRPMTISNAVNKTLILLAIVVFVAYYSWQICASGYTDKANLFLIVGSIAGLILAIVTAIKPQHSKITAPLYAVCEGLVVGAISFSYGQMFEGIVLNAIMITILALLSMLLLYRAKIIQATETFRKTLFTATLAVFIFYLVGFVASLLGHPMTIFNGGMIGIGVSLLICGIAAFNFIIDFDFIEQGEKNMLPSYFEWYGAFALLVTLIWLYIEVLRLLALFAMRKDD